MDVIAIEGLVKRYDELLALDHFDLHVDQGEIFGLLGPNGSGKTTSINCMLALLTYDRGSIRLFGESMAPSPRATTSSAGSASYRSRWRSSTSLPCARTSTTSARST